MGGATHLNGLNDPFFTAQLDGIAHQLVDTSHHLHGNVVHGQNFGKLCFADGADQSHEVDFVLFHDPVEGRYPGHGTLDAQIH